MFEWFHRGIALLRPVGIASSVAFSVGLVFFSTKTPSKEVWEAGGPLLIALIATGVATAIYQPLVNVDQHRRAKQATLDDACREMAAHLDEACEALALRFIGVHIWRVQGFWRWRWLARAGQFLIRRRASSNVRWTPGKGAVGIAWEERAPVIVDLESIYGNANSRAEWEALPERDRLKLEWEERRRTSIYKAIYATPLFNRSNRKVIGVLAIDVLESGHFAEFFDATEKSRRFNSILGLCQDALQA